MCAHCRTVCVLHEMNEPLQLLIGQISERFDPAQYSRRDRRFIDWTSTPLVRKKELKFRDFGRFAPSDRSGYRKPKCPATTRSSLTQLTKAGQLDGAIDDVVRRPNTV